MMQEYCKTKEQYKDCILFYRLGDFYEMFFDDALLVTRELEITLTGKDCGLEERAPMCGVPYHAAETYINRLIERGHKVAICEQVEDPKKAKGLVKREVVRIVTPGTTLDSSPLRRREPWTVRNIKRQARCFINAMSVGSIPDQRKYGAPSTPWLPTRRFITP